MEYIGINVVLLTVMESSLYAAKKIHVECLILLLVATPTL